MIFNYTASGYLFIHEEEEPCYSTTIETILYGGGNVVLSDTVIATCSYWNYIPDSLGITLSDTIFAFLPYTGSGNITLSNTAIAYADFVWFLPIVGGDIVIDGSIIVDEIIKGSYEYIVPYAFDLVANLDANQVIPNNPSIATSYANLSWDTTNLILSAYITHNVTNINGIKLYKGIPDENGILFFNLTLLISALNGGNLNSPIEFDFNYTGLEGFFNIDAFTNERLYLIFTSTDYPDGEIRGQVYLGDESSIIAIGREDRQSAYITSYEWNYTANTSNIIILYNSAICASNKYNFIGSGEITTSNLATYNFLPNIPLTAFYNGSGVVTISDTAITTNFNYRITSSGTTTISGEAIATLPNETYEVDLTRIFTSSMNESQILPIGTGSTYTATSDIEQEEDGNLIFTVTHTIPPAEILTFGLYGPATNIENGDTIFEVALDDFTSPFSFEIAEDYLDLNFYYLLFKTTTYSDGEIRGNIEITNNFSGPIISNNNSNALVYSSSWNFTSCPEISGFSYDGDGGISINDSAISNLDICTAIPDGYFPYRAIRLNNKISNAMHYLVLTIFTDPDAGSGYDCDDWNGSEFILFYDSFASGHIFKRQGRLDDIDITLKTQPSSFFSTTNCNYFLIDEITVSSDDFELTFEIDTGTGTVNTHPINITTTCADKCWRFEVSCNAGFRVIPYTSTLQANLTTTGLTGVLECSASNTTYGPSITRTSEIVIDDYIIETTFSGPTTPFPNKKVDINLIRVEDGELENLSISGSINSLGALTSTYQPTSILPWFITTANLNKFSYYQVNNRKVTDPFPVMNLITANFTSTCGFSSPTMVVTEVP